MKKRRIPKRRKRPEPAPAGAAMGDDFFADPYPTFHRLREESPAHWWPTGESGFWIISRYEDVANLLVDPRANREIAQPQLDTRRLLQKAFTPSAMAAMRGSVQNVVEERLDAFGREADLDFHRHVAAQVPSLVVAGLLGIEAHGVPEFQKLCRSVLRSSNPFATEVQRRQGALALRQLQRMLSERIEQLRELDPADLSSRTDFVSLITAESSSEREVADWMLIDIAQLVVMAGIDTTTSLLDLGLLTLLEHPEQCDALRAEPQHAAGAVQEMLRFQHPVLFVFREVVEDFTLHGQSIKRGQQLLLSVAAAHRDARAFDDPDRFDILRERGRSLVYGAGAHACLGAPLANLEAELVLVAFLQHYSTLHCDRRAIQWRNHLLLRGVRSFQLTHSP